HYINIYEDNGQTLVESFEFADGTNNRDTEVSISGGNKLVINPDNNLAYGTPYYITIDAGAIEGTDATIFQGFSESTFWRFTTIQQPQIITYLPAQDASDIGIATNFELTFDKPIQFNSTATTYYINIYEDNGQTLVESFEFANSTTDRDTEVTISDGNKLVINPNANLHYLTTYYFTIEAGAIEGTDGTIFQGFTEPNHWQFTTGTPPVTTITPANNATAVSIYTHVIVDFDMPVRLLDGTEIDDTNVNTLISFPTIPGSSSFTYTASINTTKTRITIIPDANLSANTQYSIRIGAVESYSGNEQSESTISTFTTDIFKHWLGTVSTDWTEDQNWSDGTYTDGISVTIDANSSNMPIISTSTDFNNIVVEPGAQLTIAAAGSLRVRERLVLLSSNDQSTGNASLLTQGTLTIDDESKVEIHQNVSNSPLKWYFLSSPVANASLQSINCNGAASYWEPNGGNWSSTTTLTAGQGYRLYSYSNMVFSGSINNADSYNFTAHRNTKNSGWGLAGNPYPCAIDWDAINLTGSGLVNAFYLWLNDSQQYGTYNGQAQLGTNMIDLGSESHIPSMHAFWIKADLDQTSGTLTIPESARTHNNFTYLKGAQMPKPVLRLIGIKNGKSDELALSANAQASTGFDNYDSEKMFASSSADLLQIYAITEGKKLTINTFDEFTPEKIIDLGIRANVAGNATIKLKSLDNFPENMQVILEDLTENILTDITNLGQYDFTTAKGSFNDRFRLHLHAQTATDIDTPKQSSKIQVYAKNKSVFIQIPELTHPQYSLYDLAGSMEKQGLLNHSVLNTIHVKNTGMYIVKIISKEGIFTEKILVK
ncbi:T9SS C-terminal target domain-containing protein, partial [Marinilabiliaceae bacterium JC017]